METFIPASSPLFTYSPCIGCTSGFAHNSTASSPSTSLYTSSNSTVSLSFTGFGIAFALPNADSSAWTTSLLVNGSGPSSDIEITSKSLANLPRGTHLVTFHAESLEPSTDPLQFDGASIDLGYLSGAGTINTTIDDTAWRDWKIELSSGWNMLEQEWPNWINDTQMEDEKSTQDKNLNHSVSWTEQANASTTVQFTGSAVWAYGVSGDDTGEYEVVVDGRSAGRHNASGGTKQYGSLLYHTSGLADTNHTLTLRNLVQGKKLYFDYLQSLSGLLDLPIATAPIPTVSASPAPSSPSGLNTGTIVGISLGGAAVVLALLIWFLVACTRLRRDLKPDSELPAEPSIKQNRSFLHWSTGPDAIGQSILPLNDKSHPWRTIHSPPPPLTLSNDRALQAATPSPPLDSDTTFRSETPLSSSFLRLSKSPKRSKTSMFKNPEDKRKTAMVAALIDSNSPLTNLRESYLPKLGRRERKKSPSVGTVLDEVDEDRSTTPGGILDGFGDLGWGRKGGGGGEEDEEEQGEGRRDSSRHTHRRAKSSSGGFI